jgi:hypothetical protein
MFSVTRPPLRCAAIALLIVGHSVLSSRAIVLFVWCSNAGEVEVALARNVFGSTSMEVAPAQIARSSFKPGANAGTALCVTPCAGRILLDALCMLDSTVLVAILWIDEGLGLRGLIDTARTTSFTMCTGHANGVTVTPSFRYEAEVAFRVIWQIASICFVHSWNGWLNPFVVQGLF